MKKTTNVNLLRRQIFVNEQFEKLCEILYCKFAKTTKIYPIEVSYVFSKFLILATLNEETKNEYRRDCYIDDFLLRAVCKDSKGLKDSQKKIEISCN